MGLVVGQGVVSYALSKSAVAVGIFAKEKPTLLERQIAFSCFNEPIGGGANYQYATGDGKRAPSGS